MEAIVYVRHAEDCPHREYKFWCRCRCRKWIYVPGEVRRISAKSRSWEQAEREARRLSGSAQVSDEYGQGVRSAVNAYLEDKEQQSLSKPWTYKIKRDMESLAAVTGNGDVAERDCAARWSTTGQPRKNCFRADESGMSPSDSHALTPACTT